jgi:hypothetical protein
MKTLVASSTLVAALLLAAGPSATAQQSGRFCLTGGDSGAENCSYDTMEQCKAAMKGTSTESCSARLLTTGSGSSSRTRTPAPAGKK